MRTAVLPGDPRASGGKLPSVAALLPAAPYGRRMTRRLTPAGRETTVGLDPFTLMVDHGGPPARQTVQSGGVVRT
jgi:hypothetical protein